MASKRQKQDTIPEVGGTPAPPPLSQSPAIAPAIAKPRGPAKITVISTQVVKYNQDRKLAFNPAAIIFDDEDDDLDIIGETPAPTPAVLTQPKVAIPDRPESSAHKPSSTTILKLKALSDMLSKSNEVLKNLGPIQGLVQKISDQMPVELEAAMNGIFTIDSHKADYDAALDRLHQREKLKEAEEELQSYIHDANEQYEKLTV